SYRISLCATTGSLPVASRSWHFFLKFKGALPRTIYQFIVLTIARTTGAGFEWHDHIEHASAAGLPPDVIDCIASARTDALPQPYALLHAILTKTMAW